MMGAVLAIVFLSYIIGWLGLLLLRRGFQIGESYALESLKELSERRKHEQELAFREKVINDLYEIIAKEEVYNNWEDNEET